MESPWRSASPNGSPSSAVQSFARKIHFKVVLTALLLVLSTMLVYNPVVHSGFVIFDDPDYVTMNPHVLQGLTTANVVGAFTSNIAANWHPLTWLSHMMDIELFKLNPMGHHLTSLFIHLINVVLIFLLLLSLTGHLWRSAVVAALFALHPLNVESVAWISERKTVLCTLFMVLALWAYKWYVDHPGIRRYLLVVLFFAMALMAKAMAVTFPFLLLLLDYWPLQRMPDSGSVGQDGASVFRRFRKLFMEKLFLFPLAAGSAVITTFAARAAGVISASQALPLRYRIENAVYAYFLYIVKGLWPAGLSVFYPHPGTSLVLWKVIAAGCVLTVVTIAVWRYRTRRYLVTGWLWYLGSMVPVIGLVQVGQQAMADRYAYIPFLGLFLIVVWLLADASANRRVAQIALSCVTVAVLSAYSYLSYQQAGYWRDTVTLFSRAVEVTPNNVVAETDLGAGYLEKGLPGFAVPHLVKAVRLDPFSPKGHNLLATALIRQGRTADAVREYRVALQYPSEAALQASIHNNLGAIFLQANRLSEARSEFNLAISINPLEQNSFLGRGSIEYQERNLDGARQDFSRAAEISPSALAFYWLGRTLEDQSDPRAAIVAYSTALQLAPGMADARTRLEAIRPRVPK
jgi:hypothetical protein